MYRMCIMDVKYRNNISRNIQLLMDRSGINPTELARRVNIPQPTIQRILANKSNNPHSTTLTPIAKYFGVSILELKSDKLFGVIAPKEWNQVPILEWRNIEAWISNSEQMIHDDLDVIPTNLNISNKAFVVKIDDWHSCPQFPKNTLLLFDPGIEAKDSCYILVHLNNHKEIFFRQLVTDVKEKFIKPLNPDLGGRLTEIKENDRILGTLFEARFYYQN